MTQPREILFEFKVAGTMAAVTAVDPGTMVEATILGPVSAGEGALKALAVRKLDYLLKKRDK